MGTAANAITTTTNIQNAPGYNSSWSTTQLENAIDRVSSFIESYCGCNFVNTTYTEKYDGDGTREIMLDHSPIVSVSALTDTPTGGTAVTISASTEILIYGAEGIVKLKSIATSETAFNDDEQNIAITYVAGQGAAIANLPPDIVEAATRLVVAFLTASSPGVKSEKIGDYSVTWDGSESSIPAEVKVILDLYKRNHVV